VKFSSPLRTAVWLQVKVRESGLGCGLGCTPAPAFASPALQ